MASPMCKTDTAEGFSTSIMFYLSLTIFSRVRVARSLVQFFPVGSFLLFLLAIVLSVLRFTASEYPSGIFKLYLNNVRRTDAYIPRRSAPPCEGVVS
jgi:hypothetical protein